MSTSCEVGLLYELARELIGGKMSKIAAEIGRERSQSAPDCERIRELQEKSTLLFVEREDMRSDDESGIRCSIARHSRLSGEELTDLLGRSSSARERQA